MDDALVVHEPNCIDNLGGVEPTANETQRAQSRDRRLKFALLCPVNDKIWKGLRVARLKKYRDFT